MKSEGVEGLAGRLGLATAEQLSIVSGAGVSAEHPTHAPDGIGIKTCRDVTHALRFAYVF